jgi:hypothetical protein
MSDEEYNPENPTSDNRFVFTICKNIPLSTPQNLSSLSSFSMPTIQKVCETQYFI